jgi:RNA polymerase sigma factor (sigma-70 family)
MAHVQTVLGHIRQLVDQESWNGATDVQLLHAFATGRREGAFAALLRRHGPLVLSVCRRLLRHEHDAEDVFQATFLLLARKAKSIRKRASVGSWLCGVARRLALRAKDQNARRQTHEQQAARLGEPPPKREAVWGELQEALDEALRSLPEKYRSVLLLCYLEDRTQEEAAAQVGCPLGTVRSRLYQGRKLLRQRLARRGFTPSAGGLAALLAASGASAAVPEALRRQTLKLAAGCAAGSTAALVPARVANLLTGGVESMFATKLKMGSALLFLTGLLALGAGVFSLPLGAGPARDSTGQVNLAPEDGPVQAPARPAPGPGAGEQPPGDRAAEPTMTVTGQVQDARGKPLGNAAVAILAWRNTPRRGGELSPGRRDVLGQTKTDARGAFAVRVQRTDSVRFFELHAVAAAPGHALGWQELDSDAEQPKAAIRLPAETVIQGRLVDLQGQPAAGVKVAVSRLARNVRGEPRGVGWGEADERLPLWPQPATTDERGRFEIRGVNRSAGVILTVRDSRFAQHSLAVPVEPRGKDGEVSFSLPPAQVLEGRVTYADTGKPAANARVFMSVDPSVREDGAAAYAIGGTGTYGVRTDAQGRFRLHPARGRGFLVTAYADQGQPYLTVRKQLLWPKGEVQARMEITLPRGILVRGKVTEAPGGKPVAGAGVYYQPLATNPTPRKGLVLAGTDGGVLTDRDGAFQIPVIPGAGHLLVSGPTLDYIRLEVEGNKLYNGKTGGRRAYPHGLVPLDLKPGGPPPDVAVTLRRGVSVSGRLLDPDGKPVAEALLFCRLNGWPWFIDYHPHLSHRHVRNGRFELRGLDPKQSYPVYVLDAKNKLGAVVTVSGKQAGGEPVVVRLAPCGSATLRVVDPQGKPWANYRPPVELIITPGASTNILRGDRDPVRADSESLVNLDRVNYWTLRTDAEGRVTLPALIPGATYRLTRWTGEEWVEDRDFTVEAGRTRKLDDLVMKRSQ